MAEQELKLHVPKEAHAGVEKDLLRGRVTRMRLQAFYFDTPDRDLVRAKIALRLRREGEQWVQTLKMPGENALSRIEINHDRPSPDLDLSVYAAEPFAAVLAKHAQALAICYETDVKRIFRQTRTDLGVIEIALDTGLLRAGSVELPISEIEFELKRGELRAIFALGKKWQQAHGLILDARSKSERGDRLALLNAELKTISEQKEERQESSRRQAIAQFWAARTAENITLHPKIDAQAALAAVAQHFIGFLALLEGGFGRRITRVAVRVELHRAATVRLLQLVVGGGAGNAQHFVIIALAHIVDLVPESRDSSKRTSGTRSALASGAPTRRWAVRTLMRQRDAGGQRPVSVRIRTSCRP